MFDQLKNAVDQMVKFIVELVNMIKEFVAGFKTEITFDPSKIPTAHFE